MNKIIEELLKAGWREDPSPFKKESRCLYKRYDTPTRCVCNDDKPGRQVDISVSKLGECLAAEVCLFGALPDGSWVELRNYSLPASAEAVLAVIPRLLKTWECIANEKTTTQ